ncbi:ComEC/Rec2 family competence protein, partial [Rhodothermus sp. AH-315-K08]|nr:ComEC/Rec2 family competence protein [Rhodothermus sp. AH-315-K08]
MAVGDKAAVPRQVIQAFRRSGLAHLLAISGFHVAVVAVAIHFLVGGILSRTPLAPATASWARAGLTTAGVLIFAGITGGATSTIRAAAMAALLLGRRVLGIPGRMLHHALFLVAVILLVVGPGSLFRPGMLLSFFAVFGLISDVRGLRSIFAATATAMLFTTPVQAHFFNELNPIGLLSNLGGGPLSSGILVGAFYSLFLSAIWLPLASLVATATTLLGSLLISVATFFASAPVLSVGSEFALPLFAALAVGRVPRESRGRIMVSAAGVILVLAAGSVGSLRPLQVDFLDVGQGDAALVRLPTGESFLVDTGRPGSEWVVSPLLKKLGIRPLPLIVITHDHMDHVGGYRALEESGGLIPTMSSTKSARASVTRLIRSGDRIDLSDEVRVFVLGPDLDTAPVNDQSVVLLLVYGSTRFLLLGDAERMSEQNLVRRWGALLSAD